MATFPLSRMHLYSVVAPCVALCACTFNTSSVASYDDAGAGGVDDSGTFDGTRPDAIPPADCPEDIHIELQVSDKSAPIATGEPYIHTFVGDTVELSAVGTCTRSGQIQYRWSVEPASNGIQTTALPDLVSETISVYSLRPGQTNVRLEIGDGNTTKEVAVFAFEAHGFQEIGSYPGTRIRNLSAGADYLWIGADDDAYRGDLGDPFGDYPLVNDIYQGDSVSSKLRVHEAAAGDYVWFSSDDAEGRAYRLRLSDGQITTIDTSRDARAKAIDDANTGIRIAMNEGVFLSADSETFEQERSDSSDALSYGPTGSWAGRDRLYPLPDAPEIDLFSGSDDIQCLADDGAVLWIGSDSDGVATYFGGAVQMNYKTDNSELLHNDVETMAIDSLQDVWVGTPGGVGRFKRDRQVWIPLAGDSGLGEALDVDVIEIDDTEARRAIYVGGRDGLFVMRTP